MLAVPFSGLACAAFRSNSLPFRTLAKSYSRLRTRFGTNRNLCIRSYYCTGLPGSNHSLGSHLIAFRQRIVSCPFCQFGDSFHFIALLTLFIQVLGRLLANHLNTANQSKIRVHFFDKTLEVLECGLLDLGAVVEIGNRRLFLRRVFCNGKEAAGEFSDKL